MNSDDFDKYLLSLRKEPRSSSISVRVEPSLKEFMAEDCKDLGIGGSEYIVRCVLCRMHTKAKNKPKTFIHKDSLEKIFN